MPTCAVIGLGIGEQHILGYREGGGDVVSVCDLDRDLAQLMAAEYGIGHVTTDWKEAVDRAEIVSICSYDQDHAEQVIYALRRGKKVLCEKPLCTNVWDFFNILRAYRWNQKLMVHFPLRLFVPRLQGEIEKLGRIRSFEAGYWYGRKHKLESWRGQKGYSMVMGGMIHMIDLVGLLLGGKWRARGVVSAEHTVQTIVESENCIGMLWCDFAGANDHHHRLVINGEKGRLVWENRERSNKRALPAYFVEGTQDWGLHDFGVHRLALRIDRKCR